MEYGSKVKYILVSSLLGLNILLYHLLLVTVLAASYKQHILLQVKVREVRY
jgi:hypothetical protein